MLAIDDVVSVGSEFRATLRVTNIGPVGWRTPATGDATPAPLLFSHSMPHRSVELDYGRAFLDKHIAPGQYRNLEPVGYYSRYPEHKQARVAGHTRGPAVGLGDAGARDHQADRAVTEHEGHHTRVGGGRNDRYQTLAEGFARCSPAESTLGVRHDGVRHRR